jgi:hypothetical protein
MDQAGHAAGPAGAASTLFPVFERLVIAPTRAKSIIASLAGIKYPYTRS